MEQVYAIVSELAPASETLPGRVALVDWEHAGMGHYLFDLASLAIHNHLDEPVQERLLAAYLGEEPGEARLAALGLMRLVAHAREAASALANAAGTGPSRGFEALASEHFEELLRAAGDARFEDWLGSAAA